MKLIQLPFVTSLLILLASPLTLIAQTYDVGDIVSNQALVRRDGEVVNLYDLEGKIIFIEWFAWWCPFCQAAAPEIRDEIVNYYKERGGTPEGIEIVHIGANLQSMQDPQTNNFIQTNGIEFAIDDTNRQLANQFLATGGQPLFAIINGVANSPSHAQWELVFEHDGYGNLSQPVTTFRQQLESVLAGEQTFPDKMGFDEFFPRAFRLENGWYFQSAAPALGLINVSTFPWIYQPSLGFWYIDDFAGMDFAFDPTMGWLYIHAYPYLYRYSDGAWLYYEEGSRAPRYFFNFSTSEWESN